MNRHQYRSLAEAIADYARSHFESRTAWDHFVSFMNHPWRPELGVAMRHDERATRRELIRALAPIAEAYEFCELRIWTDGPRFITLQRETIVAVAL